MAGRLTHGLLAAAVVAAPELARAGDGLEPRTPVLWDDPPCLTIVDRGASSVLHIYYAIPREDTEVTADEVEDSRRHQFVAFCRQESPQLPLPDWLSRNDVEAAAAKGLLDPANIVPAEVLEESAWADCFARINADADRRPITFAAATAGVAWDTAALAPGVYTVSGYTWHPPFNVWSPRPGVVKIVDALKATDDPPAAAVSNAETIIHRDEVATIAGCVDALPGSTISAAWAPVGPPDEQAWTMFASDAPVDGDSFSIEFAPPLAIVGDAANIRVEVAAPNGKSYVAYLRDPLTVLGSDAGSCEASGFIGGPGCASTGAGASTGDSGASSSTATTGPQGDGSGGCNCGAAPPRPWWFAWVILVTVRRRLTRRADDAESLRARPHRQTACRAARAPVRPRTLQPRRCLRRR